MKVINPLFTKIFFSVATLSLLFSSCIRKEALNKEADILKVEVKGVKLMREPQITNTEIRMLALEDQDVTAVTLTFTLSKGATISPESGKPQDFTNPVVYTVTAEDKATVKKYVVSILKPQKKEGKSITFNFEQSETKEGNGQAFHVLLIPEDLGLSTKEWTTSNIGFSFTGMGKTPEDFPVSQAANGYKGKCVKLTTKDTGDTGASFGAPMAAGSLFLGKLDPSLLLGEPIKSTQFGIPFSQAPSKLAGYYKYSAGEIYKEGKEIVEGKKDTFDLYAMLYEVTKETPHLDGTNSLTSENIVLLARIEKKEEAKDWTAFEIPFKPMNGKKVDAKKLKEGGYNFAIVASSSIGGATFAGAVGSTLLLDELQVFIEE